MVSAGMFVSRSTHAFEAVEIREYADGVFLLSLEDMLENPPTSSER